MNAPIRSPIRTPSHRKSSTPSGKPDRYREEKSLNATVSQRKNDRREQILEGLRQDRQVLHEHEDVHPPVLEGQNEALHDRG